MKKLLAILMSAMLVMAIIGCKPKPKEETAPAAPPAEQAPAPAAPTGEQAPAAPTGEQAPAGK
jgi:hypothetical protein